MSTPTIDINLHGKDYVLVAKDKPDPNAPKEAGDIVERLMKLKARPLTPEQEKDRAAEEEQKRQDKITVLIANADVPKRQWACETRQAVGWSETLDALKAKLGRGFIVALVGTRGAGKSQIGIELIRHSVRNLITARYVRAMDFFISLKATFRQQSHRHEGDVIEEFRRPAFLVIDECTERSDSDWENRLLTNLIDKRYADEKDTLLVGNLPKDEFSKSMGDSIISRLNQTGGIKECNWKSFRE